MLQKVDLNSFLFFDNSRHIMSKAGKRDVWIEYFLFLHSLKKKNFISMPLVTWPCLLPRIRRRIVGYRPNPRGYRSRIATYWPGRGVLPAARVPSPHSLIINIPGTTLEPNQTHTHPCLLVIQARSTMSSSSSTIKQRA